MIAGLSTQTVSRSATWFFCICLTAILLGYQTVLLSDSTPTVAENLMAWLTNRGVLIIAITYGYWVTRWYATIAGKSRQKRVVWLVVHGGGLLSVGSLIYMITGDNTFFGLVLAACTLVAFRRVRWQWMVVMTVVLLLDLPVQCNRWYEANQNRPVPTSGQVSAFEKNQHDQRQQLATETQLWLDRDYAKLARFHAAVWPERLLYDLLAGRWALLVGMVLLGMLFRRWQRLAIPLLNHSWIALAGVCGLTTLLELTSGHTYATTLRLYFDSLRYPGYYVFDVPDALYMTVADVASVSAALLVIVGVWLLADSSVPDWVQVRQRAVRKKLALLRVRSYAE